jgi:hypothetical protein
LEPLFDLSKKDNDKFHKTKLLLMIYRKVVWRMEDALYEVNETAYEFGSTRISNLVDFLSVGLDEYDSIKDKQAIEDRLMNIAESKSMIEIVDKALIKLRSHPDHGEIYFNIIKDSYINQQKLSDNQIIRKYHLSQSTYYRYKKKAIELLGIILWGYILPSLREVWRLGNDLVAEERVRYIPAESNEGIMVLR